MGRFLMALKHLASMGEFKLANKLIKSVKSGKTIQLTNKELKSFEVVKRDFMAGLKESSPGMRKGTSLRREYFHSPRSGEGGHAGRAYFSRTENTPMVDIDLPDFLSHGGAYNFKTKKDALKNLKEFMKTRLGSRTAWKMYDTPAGIRMFDVSKGSRGAKPDIFGDVGHALGGDKVYIRASKGKKAYDMRIMPKPGRKGDFIAKKMTDIRTKGAKPGYVIGRRADVDPKSLREINEIHDILIRLILANQKMTGQVDLPGLLKFTNLAKII
jgi:hypothetical protein